jgi:hypothetical protein
MKCLDDCHNYDLETYIEKDSMALQFYWLGESGLELDGVTNEEVIKVLIHRISYLNDSKFKCRENSIVITKLEEALMWLEKRTANRIARKVEGRLIP